MAGFFAKPVYGFQFSYLMRLFIVQHGYIFHRPRFFRQKALLLTTAGFAGFNDILKYLDSVARIWGFDVAARVEIRFHATFGTLHPYVVQENEKKLQKAAGAFLTTLQRGTRSKPKLFDVIGVHIGRAFSDNIGERAPAEHNYWAKPSVMISPSHGGDPGFESQRAHYKWPLYQEIST